MKDFIDIMRPVRVGIVLGLTTMIFGMLWVMFVETQHEFLHKVMAGSTIELELPSLVSTAHAGGSGDHSHGSEVVDTEAQKDSHHNSTASDPLSAQENANSVGHHKKGSEDLEAKAHTRLIRGHIHAMGLGLLVVLVSVMLAFTVATDKVKHITSTCLGVGGFLYPFSWIIMGLFTPSFGAEGAESAVMVLVGPSVLLILGSLITTLYYTYKTLFDS